MVIRDNLGYEYSLYKSKQSCKEFNEQLQRPIDVKNKICLRFLKHDQLGLIKPLRKR